MHPAKYKRLFHPFEPQNYNYFDYQGAKMNVFTFQNNSITLTNIYCSSFGESSWSLNSLNVYYINSGLLMATKLRSFRHQFENDKTIFVKKNNQRTPISMLLQSKDTHDCLSKAIVNDIRVEIHQM